MTELLIPLLFLAAAVTAMARRQETYAALLRGAQGGLRLLATLAPTLIVLLALLSAVGGLNEENRQAVLRAAGSLGKLPAEDYVHEELAWRLEA